VALKMGLDTRYKREGGPGSIFFLPTRLQADLISDNYCLNRYLTDSVRIWKQKSFLQKSHDHVSLRPSEFVIILLYAV